MKTALEWEESVSWQRLANCAPAGFLSWADVWRERLAFIRAIGYQTVYSAKAVLKKFQ